MLTETKLALLGVSIALLGAFHFYEQNIAVQNAKAQVEQTYKAKLDEAATAAQQLQSQFASSLDTAKKEKDEKINALAARNVELNRMLSNRPSRPADNSTTPKTGESCTGAQLYREDGEFLAREAARAERVLEERNFYWKQYENARVKLEELNDRQE